MPSTITLLFAAYALWVLHVVVSSFDGFREQCFFWDILPRWRQYRILVIGYCQLFIMLPWIEAYALWQAFKQTRGDHRDE